MSFSFGGGGGGETLGNPESDGQVLASATGGVRYWVDAASASDLTWVIGETTGVPVVAWGSANVQVNSTGTITMYLLGGNAATSYTVTSGSLPNEFTLEADGSISYTTTGATSSGSFGITPSNPAGSGDEFVINYEISQANGMAQFTNSESLYPFVRISTSNSTDNQILLLQPSTAWGQPTSTGNGTWISDTNYPVWSADNGNGTYTYLVQPNGYSYWMLYVNCTTSPLDLTNGTVTDLTTASTYDLVAPTSSNITVGTVNYPSDQSDIHYGTGQRFLRVGNDVTLDGFLSNDNSWSYGFKLVDAWPRDSLGRTMFCREGRNWHSAYIGHNDTYTAQLVGNGSGRAYDGEDVALPANGLTAGTYIRVTFDGTTLDVYADGVKYWSYGIASIYWDGASSTDVLDVVFGRGPESNTNQTNTTYSHGQWQGRIERLWISNGSVISTDDSGTVYPSGTTHSWDMDEVTGNTFAASTGSITMVGDEV